MSKSILAPSILAADFSKLGDHIKQSVDAGAQWIHCDIMDGHFVPNISYGPLIVAAARKSTNAFLDVHLMIYNPDQYIEAFVKAGAQLVSVHIEATPHIHRSLQHIRTYGIQAGVAINPGTPITSLEAILPDTDLVVLMSVNPGFGGQQFILNTYSRLLQLKQLRDAVNPNCLIEIDGGVGPDNAAQLIRAGADVLVAGSSVFGATNISKRVQEIQHIMAEAQSLPS
jgi:ribulose-phosphate 3-epimerase